VKVVDLLRALLFDQSAPVGSGHWQVTKEYERLPVRPSNPW
jgi:hypothetical protein